MRHWLRCSAAAWAMWLAVSGTGAEDGSAGSLKMSAVKADEMESKLNELTMAFRKLLSDSAELQLELQEKELANKALTERLALAKNEAALLREKLKQGPASQPGDVNAVQTLNRVEQERAQLAEELARLKVVLEQALHGKEGLSIEQRAQALAEAERVKRLLASQQPMARAQAALANEGVPVAQPTLESGQVLSFSSELKVAVLNLGEAHGVRLGMPFVVVRGDRIIAHVKVVEVRKKISGAVIEKVEHGIVIQSGDRVRLTKS